MPTLLEKIEANAAQRLSLPAGRMPAQELARYKNFLKVESHRLKMLHRAGSGGREICLARAAVLDVLLRYILQVVQQSSPPERGLPPMALVAIGGYGRGELNPHSDVDIMFLLDGDPFSRGKLRPALSNQVDGVLYTLWDIGLKVGHSVRSITDCIREANRDMQSKTSLIEARFITGSKELFLKLQMLIVEKCVKGYEDAYFQARLEDQELRRAKHGDSACMQEPNIKNGCGGLRDYQNLLWMAFLKYRTRSLRDLEERQLISETERRQLEAAYDYLLRVRNELHYQVDRAVDILPKSLQPTVAYQLGYTDRSPVVRLEKFMRQFYTHSRHVHLITRTLEQRLALLPRPQRLPFLRSMIPRRLREPREQVIDGFKILEGEIHFNSVRVFREQPRRLMKVFLYAQQRGLKLHPDLAQLLRNQVSLVDNVFLKDEHVHETFLEILNQRGNVAPILRSMHEVGFLGKYLPEFGKLTCLVQHEFYHRYTADEHTLVCLEMLDRIWDAEQPPFNHYTEIFQHIERPFVLYLALLLHDAGKATHQKGHSNASSELASRVARRLGLNPTVTHTLRLIIDHHLLMSQVSQRRDLDDPAVIRNFAGIVKTSEHLVFLTLHTFVDSQGTSDQLWNDFKETLLWTLYQKTLNLLTRETEFLREEEHQREQLSEEVRSLAPRTITEDEVRAHFETLPPRYFQIHSARAILADIALIHRFLHLQLAVDANPLEPIVNWHNEPDRAYSVVKVCTWNRAGLFSKIAGSLAAAGLNILSAQIFSRKDGIILDSLFVNDARTGKLANREEREKFEQFLLAALTGAIDFPALISQVKFNRPLYQSLPGERIPTVIHFDNSVSETRSVIDIETEDRVGLLYAIASALAELGLDVAVAKISTEKGAAIDTFYVSELDGSKLLSAERQKAVEQKLRGAIAALDSK